MVCNPVVVAAIIQKFKDFSLISGYLDSIIMRAVYKTSLYTVNFTDGKCNRNVCVLLQQRVFMKQN